MASTKKRKTTNKATKPALKAKAKPQAATKAAATPAPAEQKLSQIAAAERVLAEANEPMNCMAMLEAMSAKGSGSSPSGKTPEATLYASLLRHIRQHGIEARFTNVDRGLFTLAGK